MKHNKLVQNKMRGVIEPYTLGFLLSLIGVVVANIVHSNDSPDEGATTASNSTHLVIVAPDSDNDTGSTLRRKEMIAEYE